ncbi:rhodanese-like domain-containing protein [Bacillus alkalisoli]|uniref:rhodanese-like domain-containing protein n=1 Tax=Bacillus alkalisoli TaxID=2011008 RepID=UPI001D0D15B0|nr:rhodanese-like domain-containing protein [Bacillus alkalisoli]
MLEIKKITVIELVKKVKEEPTIILDVRAIEKYNTYHIQDDNVETINIPKTIILNESENKIDIQNFLPKHKEIIVTCTTGNSAMKCATILAENGYDVSVLDGGLTAWKERKETK